MGTKNGYDVMSSACPTRQVLDRIADKWTLLVVTALEAGGTLRFSELKRAIGGVSQKMLTQTLRTLERDGMVTREALPTVPVTVRYTLTPIGSRLAAAVGAIRSFAYENIEAIDAARDAYTPGEGSPPTPVSRASRAGA
jgi:DNA-binding HxlR family transcriptional regulator